MAIPVVCCLCQKEIRRAPGPEDRVGVEGPCQECMNKLVLEEMQLGEDLVIWQLGQEMVACR
jgi:hypothetical protein